MADGAWVSLPDSDITAPWRLGTATGPFPPGGVDPYASDVRSWPDAQMRFIALELVGPKVSTDAVRRALRRGDEVALGGVSTPHIPSRVSWAPGGLVEFARRLPSGQVHSLLLHPQASLTRVDPEERIFLLDSGDQHDPEHAHAVLSAALPLPILPGWTEWLLTQGSDDQLIIRLPACGLLASEIIVDIERWARLIQRGLRRKVLRCDC